MALPSLPVPARRLVAALLLAVVLLVLVWRHAGPARSSAPALRVAPLAAGTPADEAAAAGAAPGTAAGRARAAPRLVVDVEGAVRRPGLVHLADGARVTDAVAAAGGLTRAAERSAVNLAAPVVDGEQILVPPRVAGGQGPGAEAGGAGAAAGGSSGPVSLSAGTAEQLDSLPGIGPVTAQKIVEFRRQHGAFRSVDELDAIPGIGPARIAELKGLVVP